MAIKNKEDGQEQLTNTISHVHRIPGLVGRGNLSKSPIARPPGRRVSASVTAIGLKSKGLRSDRSEVGAGTEDRAKTGAKAEAGARDGAQTGTKAGAGAKARVEAGVGVGAEYGAGA